MVEEVHQPDSGHVDQGNPLFRLDPGMAIWFWFSFIVFILVLWKFAWKPVVTALKERETSIKDTLKEAEEARRSLEQASDRQHQLIEEGNKKASEIVERAQESSQRLAESIREKAQNEAEKMVESARVQIEGQRDAAISELKSEVVDLSIVIATKLIKANLKEDLNHKLVEDFIEGIKG